MTAVPTSCGGRGQVVPLPACTNPDVVSDSLKRRQTGGASLWRPVLFLLPLSSALGGCVSGTYAPLTASINADSRGPYEHNQDLQSAQHLGCHPLADIPCFYLSSFSWELK